MTRLMPIMLLLVMATLALVGALVYVPLPFHVGVVPRLVVGGIVALMVWRATQGVEQMD